jgi:hypothetical protein
MAASGNNAASGPQAGKEVDAPGMSDERRALAKAHAAILAETAARVVLELPMSADVDDFRRVLASGAQP